MMMIIIIVIAIIIINVIIIIIIIIIIINGINCQTIQPDDSAVKSAKQTYRHMRQDDVKENVRSVYERASNTPCAAHLEKIRNHFR